MDSSVWVRDSPDWSFSVFRSPAENDLLIVGFDCGVHKEDLEAWVEKASERIAALGTDSGTQDWHLSFEICHYEDNILI